MTIPVVWLYSKWGWDDKKDIGGLLFFAIVGDTTWLTTLAVSLAL